jgi:hypothetical protein
VPTDSRSASADDSGSVPIVAPPRRSLKLVVTLRPAEYRGCQATLAIGSAECDPVFRVLDVPDVSAALAAVPALVAEAEARWKTQPRYPTVSPSPKLRVRAEPDRPVATQATVQEPQPTPAQTIDATGTPAAPKTPGQLSLFG